MCPMQSHSPELVSHSKHRETEPHLSHTPLCHELVKETLGLIALPGG